MILEAEELAVSLYARLGFVEEDTTPQMFLDEPRLAMQASPGVEIMQAKDIPELPAFDTPYFGAERTKVFISHLRANPGPAFVTRNATGQITAYLFAQPLRLPRWVASTAR